MLHLEHVTKKFGDTVILEDAGYDFPARGLVCLMGPSGCGKSTLLNLAAGFDSDYAGTIRSCGRNLSELDDDGRCAYRRDCVGFVFQNYHLLPGFSVLENVLAPAELTAEAPEASRKKAMELLNRLGLSEKAGQKVETLSGGQKQRVAIARALMGNPRILLADEPTGALDRKTSGEIMALLRDLAAERLVVVITHDRKLCDYGDEVLNLQDGKLVPQRTLAHRGPESSAAPEKAGVPAPRKRAARNFRVHLGRYLASAGAIALGVLAFLFSLSFGNVMDREIQQFQEKNTVFNNGYIKGGDRALAEELCRDPRIQDAYPQYILENVTLTGEGGTETLEEKLPMPKTTEALSYGVMPRLGKQEIALTPSLAKKFDENIQNLLGRTLTLTLDGQEYSLSVSGIYNAGYDDFFVSADVEQTLYGSVSEETPYSVSYDVKGFSDVVPVNDELEAAGLRPKNAAAEVAAMETSFRSLGQLFLGISALVLVLAVFLCALLLGKLQSARYRELGLLSALGFRQQYLRRMIRWENGYLSALAGMVTAVLLAAAAGVCRLVRFPLRVGAAEVLGCIAGAFLVVLIVSALASARLIRTEPAAALKHT